MYKHAEKLERFLQGHKRLITWYNLKYFQMLYQGIYVVLIASVSYGNPGSCSTPVQVFLRGLFSMYIFAFVLNFFVFLVRSLNLRLSKAGYSRKMKDLNLKADFCYFPLYWAFSIVEFCWYIIGFEWVSEENDCLVKYKSGIVLAQSLIYIWVFIMFLIIVAVIGINSYLLCNQYNGSQSLEPENPLNISIKVLNNHTQKSECTQRADLTLCTTPNKILCD